MMMETDSIQIKSEGPVLHVTLDRPEKYNAMNLAIWEGLWNATRKFAADASLRVMLVTARGKYFSAGIDLHGPLVPDPAITDSPLAFRQWYREGIGSLHGLGDEWEAIGKPIVVAHQGPCLGGALEISLCADFRLAAASASYQLPEIELGGIPGSGGTSRLVRTVGPHWARWMILANKQIGAGQALAIGLVHDVYLDERFDKEVQNFCRLLAQKPPEAYAIGKLAIELAADLDRAQGRNVERIAVSQIVLGDEYKAMLAAVQARLTKKKT